MSRKSIHPDKHLERLEKLRIFKLCRRLPKKLLSVFLHHDEYLVIILCFFQEFLYVLLAHPAAENIIILLLVVADPCGGPSNIKVIGQLLQTFLRS